MVTPLLKSSPKVHPLLQKDDCYFGGSLIKCVGFTSTKRGWLKRADKPCAEVSPFCGDLSPICLGVDIVGGLGAQRR